LNLRDSSTIDENETLNKLPRSTEFKTVLLAPVTAQATYGDMFDAISADFCRLKFGRLTAEA
jgi:hypothetical protein